MNVKIILDPMKYVPLCLACHIFLMENLWATLSLEEEEKAAYLNGISYQIQKSDIDLFFDHHKPYLMLLTSQELMAFFEKELFKDGLSTPDYLNARKMVQQCAGDRHRHVLEMISLRFAFSPVIRTKDLKNLTRLVIRNSGLAALPNLEHLEFLRHLDLSNNQLVALFGLNQLKRMKILKLNGNALTNIDGLENMQGLETLNLSHNNIAELDTDLATFSQLKTLDVSLNPLVYLMNFMRLLKLKNCTLDRIQLSQKQISNSVQLLWREKLYNQIPVAFILLGASHDPKKNGGIVSVAY